MFRTALAEKRMEKFDLYPEPRSTGFISLLRTCAMSWRRALSALSRSRAVKQHS